MLETLIATVMLASLILYALMGGADYGGGMWDLLASGPRKQRQRQAIVEAIAPIWEANHVWLILVIVLLFSAFPRAFSTTMIALHIPITAMLIGIVLRGSAFIFRKYDSTAGAVQRRWSTLFGIASLFTPFFQGLTLGALTTGDIHLVGDQVTTGFFAGWLTPFALTCGLFALTLFAFLAATYMTVATQSQPDLQNDFRLRALWAEAALIPLAIIVFLTSKYGAPLMYHGLTNWWAPLLLAWTVLSALMATLSLCFSRFYLARIAAAMQVTFILAGWGLAQFPHLVTPDVTIQTAAAPESTLKLLLLALGAGAVVLLPSLFYLFQIFKTQAEP
ncbi:MAG: cytochrome d ubiquinol oxidase subunit II [Verrucomicrobia bacterium]|nr:cytochrome d ubiquinol oxidase subunit II [Verrucomicrobiota bacterium]